MVKKMSIRNVKAKKLNIHRMPDYTTKLDSIIEKLRKNLQSLLVAEEIPLFQVRPPRSPGVYMLFFEGELQYIGSSGNLNARIRTNLISGNRESHTLINKLCELRRWNTSKAIGFLKSDSNIKFTETETEDNAKILEDVLIAIYHPFYNTPLRRLKKQVG